MRESQVPILLNKGQLIVHALSITELSGESRQILEKELLDTINKIQLNDIDSNFKGLHSV